MTPEDIEKLRQHDTEATNLTIDQQVEIGRLRATVAQGDQQLAAQHQEIERLIPWEVLGRERNHYARENERLRAALEMIANGPEDLDVWAMERIARETLGSDKPR